MSLRDHELRVPAVILVLLLSAVSLTVADPPLECSVAGAPYAAATVYEDRLSFEMAYQTSYGEVIACGYSDEQETSMRVQFAASASDSILFEASAPTGTSQDASIVLGSHGTIYYEIAAESRERTLTGSSVTDCEALRDYELLLASQELFTHLLALRSSLVSTASQSLDAINIFEILLGHVAFSANLIEDCEVLQCELYAGCVDEGSLGPCQGCCTGWWQGATAECERRYLGPSGLVGSVVKLVRYFISSDGGNSNLIAYNECRETIAGQRDNCYRGCNTRYPANPLP